MIPLRHGRVELALHPLREGEGEALLLLHELRGSSAEWSPVPAWPGPVYGLDFTGHGRSARLKGGAYLCEFLAGDADAALAHLGGATLLGRGLGAYVALLMAGGRPDLVPAAVLLPGAGLAGGGAEPDFDDARFNREDGDDPLDYFENDVRPVDYAAEFAARAQRLVLVENGAATPPWWQAVRGAEPKPLRADGAEAALVAARG